MSKLVNLSKLDNVLGVERKSEGKKEVKKIDTKSIEKTKINGNLIKALVEDERLENYVFEKISNNIESAEEILETLKNCLRDGIINEKMFESAAHLINSINSAVEQINKVKAQKEKFKIDKARVAVEMAKTVKGSDIEEDEDTKGSKTLIITREALLEKILEKKL